MCIALKYGIWNVAQPESEPVNDLVRGGYPPLVAMILASRNIRDVRQAHSYLDCTAQLLDPF